MFVDPQFGPVVPERAWVPAPRYLLRRDRVLAALGGLAAGRVLELGCGAGALVYELAGRGLDCTAVETSPAAREIAEYLNRGMDNVRVLANTDGLEPASFDLVMALEVLEHIEDDAGALRDWRRWARPGAQLLVSVPAHRRHWSPSDEWAGHFRRYERSELHAILSAGGFVVERIESYGVPLANLMDPIRARVHAGELARRRASGPGVTRDVHSRLSGVDRPVENRLFGFQASVLGRSLLRLACALQRPFAGTDLGRAYLAVARAG